MLSGSDCRRLRNLRRCMMKPTGGNMKKDNLIETIKKDSLAEDVAHLIVNK